MKGLKRELKSNTKVVHQRPWRTNGQAIIYKTLNDGCHQWSMNYYPLNTLEFTTGVLHSVRVSQSLVFCEVFCRSLFVLLLLAIVLTGLQIKNWHDLKFFIRTKTHDTRIHVTTVVFINHCLKIYQSAINFWWHISIKCRQYTIIKKSEISHLCTVSFFCSDISRVVVNVISL